MSAEWIKYDGSDEKIAEMVCQWARTGQMVYVKTPARIWPEHAYIGDDWGGSYCTIDPNWNIEGAEYSFTPFGEGA